MLDDYVHFVFSAHIHNRLSVVAASCLLLTGATYATYALNASFNPSPCVNKAKMLCRYTYWIHPYDV